MISTNSFHEPKSSFLFFDSSYWERAVGPVGLSRDNDSSYGCGGEVLRIVRLLLDASSFVSLLYD